MLRKISACIVLAVAISATPVLGSVRIDFSDASCAGCDPTGFRISNPGGGPISDRLEFGSDQPLNGDMLDYLNVTFASVGGVPALDGALVVVPEFKINSYFGNVGGVDLFNLGFYPGGGQGPVAGGFKVYAPGDSAFAHLLMHADISLSDFLYVVGASGQIEPLVSLNLTNVGLTPEGMTYPALVAFKADAVLGADFLGGINAAGKNMVTEINMGHEFTGSANGSIQSTIPEPGTLLLLAVGGLFAARRARRVAA
jgi:hypothetical protein